MEHQMSKWSLSIATLNTHPIAGFRWRRLRSELAALLRLWAERSRQRRHLAEIAKWDDYVLKDIGVSRQQALDEARKPLWRP